MRKLKSILILLMTALVITTAAVSCSKDSENEPDPTPTPAPDDPYNPKSILGYWRTSDTTSEYGCVYKMQDDGILYIYEYEGEYSGKETYIDRYYFDEANGYWVYYCSWDSEQIGEWSWDLSKVISFDKNSLVLTFIADEDDGPHLTGPFDVKGCKQIIDVYKTLDLPGNGGDIMRLTRMSEKEFTEWWNSLSD